MGGFKLDSEVIFCSVSPAWRCIEQKMSSEPNLKEIKGACRVPNFL